MTIKIDVPFRTCFLKHVKNSLAVNRKDVWIEKGEYVGRASDGTIVSLGLDKLEVERYLRSYPNPTDW
jgi:hypothetical protein